MPFYCFLVDLHVNKLAGRAREHTCIADVAEAQVARFYYRIYFVMQLPNYSK